jgi:Arylsulfotransferase (ASST)
VTADTVLVPGFARGVYDYVSRCQPDAPLRLSVAAASGEAVSVDGAAARSGSFEADVPLAAGQGAVLRVTSGSRRAAYHVRCLPRGFPAWTAERHGPTQSQWYLITPRGPWMVLFDRNGTPVWWLHSRGDREPFNPTLLANGHVASFPLPAGAHFGTTPGLGFDERRLDGSVVRRIRTVGVPTDAHEIRELPNGHLLLDAYRPRAGVDLRPYGGFANSRVYDAEVQEVTRGGRLVWRWGSRGHIPLSDTGRWWANAFPAEPDRRTYDPLHINSIAPVGDAFLISCRHTDAVYKIDRASGDVVWKLGGTHTDRSLTILGDPNAEADFGGQHDVRVLADGSVTLYDNGSARGRPARALRFRIDEAQRTATMIGQLTDPLAGESSSQGSARRLDGGDWVISWANNDFVTEAAPSGAVVFRLAFPGRVTYRAFPVPYGRLSAARLRATMDRMHPRARP